MLSMLYEEWIHLGVTIVSPSSPYVLVRGSFAACAPPSYAAIDKRISSCWCVALSGYLARVVLAISSENFTGHFMHLSVSAYFSISCLLALLMLSIFVCVSMSLALFLSARRGLF